MSELKRWYCTDRACGATLGFILGGELTLADTVDPSIVRSSGNSMIIHCPKCNNEKVWYSSSPLVRSLEQFLDTLSYIIARRALNIIHKELNEDSFNVKREEE